MPIGTMSGTPQVLLAHHLKQLKLPTVLREYEKVARECAQSGVDHPRYLLRLIELELIDRERRTIERRIRAARFPAVKSFDTFDFTAIPSLNKMMVLELARCEYILRRENVIALGNSGTGKTHVALALGLAACQKGFTVAFTTAASLVSQLMEARDERRLLKLQRDLAAVKLLIVDELGYVPLSPTGAELLFEVLSQRYERGSTIITSNLPFEDWTQVLASERLTGALGLQCLLTKPRSIPNSTSFGFPPHPHAAYSENHAYRKKRSREAALVVSWLTLSCGSAPKRHFGSPLGKCPRSHKIIAPAGVPISGDRDPS